MRCPDWISVIQALSVAIRSSSAGSPPDALPLAFFAKPSDQRSRNSLALTPRTNCRASSLGPAESRMACGSCVGLTTYNAATYTLTLKIVALRTPSPLRVRLVPATCTCSGKTIPRHSLLCSGAAASRVARLCHHSARFIVRPCNARGFDAAAILREELRERDSRHVSCQHALVQ